MPHQQFTLDDLVRATGFTKRQIRFYITRKLVPGTGSSRGPHAVYPEATLLRLQRIAELKQHLLPPANRRLSLEEIRHQLDADESLDPHQVSAALAPDSSLHLTRSTAEPVPGLTNHLMESPQLEIPDVVRQGKAFLATPGEPNDHPDCPENHQFVNQATNPMLTLMVRLRDLMAELGVDNRFTAPADHGQWLRLTTPDIEINVRQPDGPAGRKRLSILAESLQQLLGLENSGGLK